MTDRWQPGAGIKTLKARAKLLRAIREFFLERQVLEVATPVLGAAGVTDLHISNIEVPLGGRCLYLQTSPEYAMKRLLASGSGPIYQLGPAFRGGESGRYHNAEFTLLEWYRPDFTLQQLAEETDELLTRVFKLFFVDPIAVVHVTYEEAFRQRYGVNPHTVELPALRSLADKSVSQDLLAHISDLRDEGTRNDLLDVLFSCIEPIFKGLAFVYDYPASQAALAETSQSESGYSVAKRFEVFLRGTEIANGYLELRDSDILAERMRSNNNLRQARGLPCIPLDEALLAALPDLPVCSGIALGIDRLLMLLTGANSLDEVIAFSDQRL